MKGRKANPIKCLSTLLILLTVLSIPCPCSGPRGCVAERASASACPSCPLDETCKGCPSHAGHDCCCDLGLCGPDLAKTNTTLNVDFRPVYESGRDSDAIEVIVRSERTLHPRFHSRSPNDYSGFPFPELPSLLI